MSNNRNRISRYVRIAIAAGAALTLAGPARSQVLPPDSVVAGKTMSEWAIPKSQWIMTTPAAMNPLLDTTGEFAYLGDQGPVFFLDGTFGGPTVTRNVTIRDDQFIHIGLLNTIGWITEPDDTERAYANSLMRMLTRSIICSWKLTASRQPESICMTIDIRRRAFTI